MSDTDLQPTATLWHVSGRLSGRRDSSGPFHAVDPAGEKHGPYHTWKQALQAVNAENTLLHQRAKAELTAESSALLKKMKARQITRVIVEYSGAGDSGDFERARITGGEASTEELETLETYVEELLQERQPGWELNEGSQGTFTFDLANDPPMLEHEHNMCVESYETTTIEEEMPTSEDTDKTDTPDPVTDAKAA